MVDIILCIIFGISRLGLRCLSETAIDSLACGHAAFLSCFLTLLMRVF